LCHGAAHEAPEARNTKISRFDGSAVAMADGKNLDAFLFDPIQDAVDAATLPVK
jgi:expansin (peptidoglycan-binding protein)